MMKYENEVDGREKNSHFLGLIHLISWLSRKVLYYLKKNEKRKKEYA